VRVLGINAIFHDPAAALVVDGKVVAAAEEERFSRRKHGKRPVPFSAWELPELSAAWCLREGGLRPEDLDAVAYSFDPALCQPGDGPASDPWDWLRVEYANRAPQFLATALPGLDPGRVRFVAHHVAHAASTALAAPTTAGHGDCAVLVLDGRGERASHLAGRYRDGHLEQLAAQALPHSLGLLYEDLTEGLGFLRSSDEYKVMALASYGKPRHLDDLRECIRTDGLGGFTIDPDLDLGRYAPPVPQGGALDERHADLAASVQTRLEEVIIELASWLYEAAGGPQAITMAGGVALNCVANARLAREGPYRSVWVQPAAGDAGTALGAALHVAGSATPVQPMPGAALGPSWSDEEICRILAQARLRFERPPSIAALAAQVLADNGVVAWFQGRSEYGPRALGHRSLLAHPGHAANTERLNEVKGREQFRPVAPMVLAERAADLFDGVLPSPYMLFVHRVRAAWAGRLPAVTHVDGTARVQTVDAGTEPLLAELLTGFEERTGLPVLVNTSLNTAGRPMVDSPRDALELFGSAPVDLLAIGSYAVRRAGLAG
jgi:carbamoyltransferase